MKPSAVSRRAVLRGGAGAAVALPFLESIMPRRAQAQPVRPKRLLIWLQPLSIYADVFWPAAPGRKPYDWRTDPMQEVHWSDRGTMDNPNFQLPEMLSFMQSHRDDLLFVEGLENSGGNHPAYSTSLTGTKGYEKSPADMISIDQVIAREIGKQTRFRSLQVGVMNAGSGPGAAASWLSKSQAAPATDNPILLWERLFMDVASNPDDAKKLRSRRQSVLDAAMNQAKSLRTRLGSADRSKVDQYLEAFREVERQLAIAPEAGCQQPGKPTNDSPSGARSLFDGDELRSMQDVPHVMKLQLDMLSMAMACDLTRVATFQFGTEANNNTFPWLGLPDWRWHDASHFENDHPSQWPMQLEQAEGWRAIAEWSLSQFNYLLDRLKALDVFDETMTMFMTSMNHGGAHKARNCPILIAGSGDGAIRTGRHVRVGHWANGGKGDHRFNDLHVAIAQAMGVAMERFGDADLSRGALPGILK